ncbi:Lcl C-terminal domain-containing protein [Colwellia sp. MEBiC06753]
MKKLIGLALVATTLSTQAAQSCNNAITATAPTSQFVDNLDGTVTDRKTGLTWMRCTLGETWDGTSCTGNAQTYNWQQALDNAQDSNLAGHSNWRLPNIKELQSIIEFACYAPAVNVNIFPQASNSNPQYWSASLYSKENNHGAWAITMASGNTSTEVKSNTKLVRLVRN